MTNILGSLASHARDLVEGTLVEGSQLDVASLPTGNSLEVPMRLAVGIRF